MEHLPDLDYSAQIQRLRAHLGLAQVALPSFLGGSFPSINRWKKGKARSSQLSWNKILKLAGKLNGHRIVEPEPPSYADTPAIVDFTVGAEVVRALVEGERPSFGYLANPTFATEIAGPDGGTGHDE